MTFFMFCLALIAVFQYFHYSERVRELESIIRQQTDSYYELDRETRKRISELDSANRRASLHNVNRRVK